VESSSLSPTRRSGTCTGVRLAEKPNFQILRRTMATQAQRMGSVKDIQAHLRHARPDTTAYEYMRELPEGVQPMVSSVYAMLQKGGDPAKGVVRCYQMLPTHHGTKL